MEIIMSGNIFLIRFLLAGILLTTTLATNKATAQELLKTVIIDPGHGLPDGGADGAYSKESDISLAIGLKLGKQLEQVLPNTKILFTRTDENLPNGLKNKNDALRYRAKMANDNKGDLFISIHCNSTSPTYHKERTGYTTETYYKGKGKKKKKYTRKVPKYRYWTTPSAVLGTETYIWAVDKNDQKKEYVGNYEPAGELDDSTVNFFDTPEAKILASLRTKKYFEKSKMLAELVETEFIKQGRSSRGARQRDDKGILVLAATAMPSILVETGFISNPEEEDYLNSEKGQDELAYAIMRAVLTYKDNLERGSGVATGTTQK
jgi:N-acetylmuramoyl-L-alanine amidase